MKSLFFGILALLLFVSNADAQTFHIDHIVQDQLIVTDVETLEVSEVHVEDLSVISEDECVDLRTVSIEDKFHLVQDCFGEQRVLNKELLKIEDSELIISSESKADEVDSLLFD